MKEILMDGSLLWWITVIEIPVLSGLFWMVQKVRNRTEEELRHIQTDFNHLQLEIARSYASANDVKEIEARLVAHLLRIEAKLDETALKAEALNAKQ